MSGVTRCPGCDSPVWLEPDDLGGLLEGFCDAVRRGQLTMLPDAIHVPDLMRRAAKALGRGLPNLPA